MQPAEQFNSSAESVTLTVVSTELDSSSVMEKLDKTQVIINEEREQDLTQSVPQAEPNTFHYYQPLTKRKSKSELRVYCPLPEDSVNLQVHEFIWKYGGKQVFLAGNFNNWNPAEIEMSPVDASNEYYRVQVQLDPTLPWEFKFIVDGVWRCNLDIATTTDMHGNTNNIIHPEK